MSDVTDEPQEAFLWPFACSVSHRDVKAEYDDGTFETVDGVLIEFTSPEGVHRFMLAEPGASNLLAALTQIVDRHPIDRTSDDGKETS